MKNIAIIPARGGSKRIPKKNIRLFYGKPIIAYSIEVALESGLFEEVMVSTDDEEIAEIAKKYGASVPFLRSKETANDYAGLCDVLIEVIEEYYKRGQNYKQICCLLSTAPFITQKRIKEGLSLLNDNCSAVFPVLRYSYPIQRALNVDKNNKVNMIYPENLTVRSQDLMPAYHDSGQFYWVNTEAMLKEKVLFTRSAKVIKLSEMEVQDIDTEEDWKNAELKYRILKLKA